MPNAPTSLRSWPRLRGVLAMALLALPLVTAAASAEEKKPGAPLRDPENVTGLSDAVEMVVQGNQALLAKDTNGAIELYRKAVALQPKSPLARFALSEGLLIAGRLPEADAELKEADAVADAKPAIKARVLFAIADLRERQKKLDEAKAAWQRYREFAGKTDAATFPGTAEARLKALDDVTKLEKAYEIVRQRIADEKNVKDAGPVKPEAGAKK